MKIHSHPIFRPAFFCGLLAASLSLTSANAQLTWDPNGAAIPDPSDGAGNWTNATAWYDGAGGHGAWVAGSQAVFGAGGDAGIVNLQGTTQSVSGLQFNGANLGSTSTNDTLIAYRFTNGTISIANGGTIDIRTGASSAQTDDRVRFDTALSGNNISISSTSLGSATAFVRLGGSNSWTGNLTLAGSAGGQFIEVLTPSAISNLNKITAGNGTTLALASSGGTFSGPQIEIQGTGSSGRAALRIDANSTIENQISLAANARIGTNNSNVTAVITGSITGAFQLDQNAGGTTAVGTIIYYGTNNFSELQVTKGNAQIGAGTAGSTTADVTVNGASAILSGTGTITGAVNVTTGVLRPGDRGSESGIAGAGTGIGTLAVVGDTTFNPTIRAVTAEFQLGSIFSDQLSITGNLNLNGESDMSNLFTLGYSPTEGDTWDIITFTGLLTDGGFDIGTNLRTGADSDANEGNLDLPDVSADGLVWEVSLGNGALTATLVPEPSAVVLLSSAGVLLGFRRRRNPPVAG